MTKKPAASKPFTRKQLSRHEREQRVTRYVTLGGVAVLAVVVLILVWGLVDQYVLRPARAVGTVSGVPIRLDTYQSLYRYRQWSTLDYLDRLEERKRQLDPNDESSDFLRQYIDQQAQQVQAELMSLQQSVLDDLFRDQIARQECAQRGITVSPDEVQAKLEEQFGYERNPPTPEPVTVTLLITETPTATVAPMTKEQFDERSSAFFQAARKNAGFREPDFRRLLESMLYREKLEKAIGATVPTTTEQVQLRQILLKTQEEAEAALARVNGGEDFAAVAKELSQDTATKEQGGEVGWRPHEQLMAELADAAFALQPGQVSQPLSTTLGFYLLKVENRDPAYPLDDFTLQNNQYEAVQKWYAERLASPIVVRLWDSTMIPKPLGGAER